MAFGFDEKVKKTLIGAYVPFSVRDRFKLYALSKGTYSGSLFISIVMDYLKDKPTEEELIHIIAKQRYAEWDKAVIERSGKVKWRTSNQISRRFEDFLNETKDELKKRRSRQDVINAIIREIEQLEINRGVFNDKE